MFVFAKRALLTTGRRAVNNRESVFSELTTGRAVNRKESVFSSLKSPRF